MEIRAQNGLIESILAQKLQAQPRTDARPSSTTQQSSPSRDIVKLSTGTGNGNSQARLVREVEEETEDGIRLTQEFETSEGRTFTRIQDFAQTSRGFHRNVIQQNPSGSTTQLEEVLNRQDNGLFQRIQRFTNEIGETQTRIDNDYVSLDAFVLTRGSGYNSATPPTARGTQYDVQV